MNPGKKLKIMIIDDVPDEIVVVRIILKRSGFDIVEARDWREAFSELKKGDVGLILLDLNMPEMDGLELLGKLRKEGPSKDVPVIVYSCVPNDGQDYRSYGSNGYVRKYSDPDVLVLKIEQVLKKAA